ncbi:MAG: hypothetical protein Kow0068_12030 [Marinilabiliales bacterium]
MLIIEFINVKSHGNWDKSIRKNRWLQVIIAAVFGIIPGCLGTYTIVSLYTHNIIGFGALVTAMISTFGDEAFIMFSLIPMDAVKITVVLFTIGIITGFIINFFIKKDKKFNATMHMEIHEDEESCQCYNFADIKNHMKKISFSRSILLFGILIFMTYLIFGKELHKHNDKIEIQTVTQSQNIDHHKHESEQGIHLHEHETKWNWIRITYLLLTTIALVLIIIVPDHFLQDHLWGHIIKKHFLKIFLWTLGTFALISVFNQYINISEWISDNRLIILLIAILVGIIPESGPHLIFVSMFISGSIPLSILLANSAVQDGHGALPLLAESRKSFLYMKAINILVGLLIGLTGFWLGF